MFPLEFSAFFETKGDEMDSLERERLIESGKQMLTRTCAAITLGLIPREQFPTGEEPIAHHDSPVPEKSKSQQALDIVWSMNEDERGEFYQQFSKSAVSNDIWLFLACISYDERIRFIKQFEVGYGPHIRRDMFEIISRELRENPNIDDDALNAIVEVDLLKAANKRSAMYWAHAEYIVEERNKKKQNQNESSPEMILRNLSICDDLAAGISKEKIAKKHNRSPRRIKQITDGEAHWRLKARQLKRSQK